jgi:hypothetical protein
VSGVVRTLLESFADDYACTLALLGRGSPEEIGPHNVMRRP